MFVSTDARGPYPRGVIGSTVGAYPRGTGSNPVEGNGHFLSSYRRLYLSSFSDAHTHTIKSIMTADNVASMRKKTQTFHTSSSPCSSECAQLLYYVTYQISKCAHRCT